MPMHETPGKVGLSQTMLSDKKTEAKSVHSTKKSIAREEYSDIVVINDEPRNDIKGFNNGQKNVPPHYFNMSTAK